MTDRNNLTKQRALANVLDAVEGVLAYDWSDNDSDAVEAIERLRKANDDYGVVQRLESSDEPAAERVVTCPACLLGFRVPAENR